jgi:hypothetical protein
MSHEIEILGPALTSKDEAWPLVCNALEHFSTAKRATIQVMADLRRLQDGQVHVLYGYKNFGKWAEDTFEGMAAGNVRQLCRAGAVALALDKRGLLNLESPKGIGTTGLRELSAVAGTYGEDKMVEVFITARDMREGGEVVGTTIEAAMQALMPPAPTDLDQIPHNQQREPPEAEADDDDDPEDTLTDKEREIIERIRDLSWDLPDTTDELAETINQLKAEIKGESTDKDDTWIEGKR